MRRYASYLSIIFWNFFFEEEVIRLYVPNLLEFFLKSSPNGI